MKNIVKTSITLMLIFYSVFGIGQAVKPVVKMSDKMKAKKTEILDEHIISTSDGHYLKAYKAGWFKFGVYLQKYDNKFNLVFSKEFKTENKKIDALDLMNMKNSIALLTKETDKKSDILSYSLVPVGFDGTTGKPQNIGKFKFEKRRDEPTFQFRQSQDSSKAALTFFVDNNNDEQKMQFYISVVTNELKEVWNKKVNLGKSQEVIEVLSSAVNSEGSVYLLYKEYEGKKAKETKKVDKKVRPAYKIKVLKVVGDPASENAEVELDLKNVFAVSTDIKVLPNGDIGALGLFSTTKRKYINGVFSLKMNAATDSIYNISKKEFSEKDLAVLNEEDNTDKHQDEEGLNDNFAFLDLSFRKDGSANIVLEENYSYTVSNYSGRGMATTYTTYYVTKDAISLELSSSGEIDKLFIIPKRQKFSNTQIYNSSVVLTNETATFLVYNEDIDNLEKPGKKRYISSLKDCVATAMQLDKGGKLIRTPLFDNEDTRAVFMPAYSKKISANQIFFVAERGGSLFSSSDRRIGIITF